MKRKYYVFVYQTSLNNGTSVLWSGYDKERFLDEIEKAKKERPHNKARIVETEDYTYYSFPDNLMAFTSWYFFQFTRKPQRVIDYTY